MPSGAALEDHIGRVDWSREQIEQHQTERLRSLLAYAKQRSPFHARRLRGIDPSVVTAADLAGRADDDEGGSPGRMG